MATKIGTAIVSDTFATRDSKTNRRSMLGKLINTSTKFMTRCFSANRNESCTVDGSLIICTDAEGNSTQHSCQLSPRTIGDTASSYKEGRFGELPDRGTGLLSKMQHRSSRRLLTDMDMNVKPAPPLRPKQERMDSAQQINQKPLSLPQKQTAKYVHAYDPEPPVPKEIRRSLLHTMKSLSSRRLVAAQLDSVVFSNDSKYDPSDRYHSCSTKNLFNDMRPIETSSSFELKKSRENLELTNLFAIFTLVDHEKTAEADIVPSDLTVPIFDASLIDRRTMMGRSFSTSALVTPRRSNLKKQQTLSSVSDHHRTPRLEPLERANSVKFDKIQVREYERTLGDNPAVSAGPPVSLGWQYTPERELDVERFETERPPRRTKQELGMPPKLREDMLVREWGHTFNELKLASSESEIIKGQRQESATQHYHAMYMEEVLERSRERRTMASVEPDAHDLLWQHTQCKAQTESCSRLFAI